MSRIIIVHDDDRSCRLLSSIADELGLEVRCFRDGLQALDALRRRPDYDLVLVDLHTPRLSAVQLLQIVNQDGDLPRIPVVVLADGAAPSEVNAALAAGAAGFLASPLTAAGVRAMLEEHLGVGLVAIV